MGIAVPREATGKERASTAPVTPPMKITGEPIANLVASTSGTDADWVVKLIDVFPDDDPNYEMSGYQLMISSDIFRGRYRERFGAAAIKGMNMNFSLLSRSLMLFSHSGFFIQYLPSLLARMNTCLKSRLPASST